MDWLYAPWRDAWVTGAVSAEEEGDCLFCRVWQAKDGDQADFVVWRGTGGLVMLNRYPYNGGHLLVAPARHAPSIDALEPADRAEMMELAALCVGVLGKVLRPHGFNLGINQGRSSGAGIPGHVHLHVVPRWRGDTNFMTTTGQTRVLSTDMEATWKQLAAGFRDTSGGPAR